jgi:hypothetical protein
LDVGFIEHREYHGDFMEISWRFHGTHVKHDETKWWMVKYGESIWGKHGRPDLSWHW